MLEHSLTFRIPAASLVIEGILLLNAASLEVAAVDLGTSDRAHIGRVLPSVSSDDLRVFLADLAASVVGVNDLDLFSRYTNGSTFLAGQVLHSFLEAHASFGHVGLFNDSVICLVDHLLSVSSWRGLLRIIISLHTTIERGGCLNVRLVHWVDSVVTAQVWSLITGLSRVAHTHVHLLFDAI